APDGQLRWGRPATSHRGAGRPAPRHVLGAPHLPRAQEFRRECRRWSRGLSHGGTHSAPAGARHGAEAHPEGSRGPGRHPDRHGAVRAPTDHSLVGRSDRSPGGTDGALLGCRRRTTRAGTVLRPSQLCPATDRDPMMKLARRPSFEPAKSPRPVPAARPRRPWWRLPGLRRLAAFQDHLRARLAEASAPEEPGPVSLGFLLETADHLQFVSSFLLHRSFHFQCYTILTLILT